MRLLIFQRFKWLSIFLVFEIILFSLSCNVSNPNKTASSKKLKDFPPVILWAWERPEDFLFLDTEKFGVAFLAQTLVLENDEVIFHPRRQPLKVSPETFLIAVTRIETNRIRGSRQFQLSESQKNQAIAAIMQTLTLPNIKAIQIDFDVLESERDFYRQMLKELRRQLPENVSLSMTALASWCAADNWLGDLPVDEIVPMAFRMGADDKNIRAFMASGKDWREPRCHTSYGLAVDEPLSVKFKPDRRFYIFNDRPWRSSDLSRLSELGVLP